MTKFGIISDLHLEFSGWDFEEEEGVHYICAGDIGGHMTRDYFLERHPNLFYIYGNHDYYGKYGVKFSESEQHMKTVTINGIKIAGAPMWTQMNDTWEWYNYHHGLADATYIIDDSFSLYNYQKYHKMHKKFLLNSNADIIVSHHSPSYLSVADKFKGDDFNKFFATELYDDVMLAKPKYWIHGHMHNDSHYKIGSTTVICHPRGYPSEQRGEYKPLIIEI